MFLAEVLEIYEIYYELYQFRNTIAHRVRCILVLLHSYKCIHTLESVMGVKLDKKKHWNVLLDEKNNFHSQLIKRELSKNEKLNVIIGHADEVNQIIDNNDVDIVLVSFTCLKEGQYLNDIYANSLNTSLVVYGIPKHVECVELSTWFGVKGMIYEDAPIEHLIRCVDAILNGGLWLPRSLMAQMLNQIRPYILSTPDGINELTKREKQILDHLVCGNSNLEIAESLYIAESTVKTHLYKLYKKLNVSCRREAIELAKTHYKTANVYSIK